MRRLISPDTAGEPFGTVSGAPLGPRDSDIHVLVGAAGAFTVNWGVTMLVAVLGSTVPLAYGRVSTAHLTPEA